jgi:LPXTG-site transpeptidase (sortase) family protein
MNPDDVLEQQLEKLFSDAALPASAPTGHASTATLQRGWPSVIPLDKPARRRPVHQPRQLAGAPWLSRSLGVMAILAVLAFLLVERANLARPVNTAEARAAMANVIAPGTSPTFTTAAPTPAPKRSIAGSQAPRVTRSQTILSPQTQGVPITSTVTPTPVSTATSPSTDRAQPTATQASTNTPTAAVATLPTSTPVSTATSPITDRAQPTATQASTNTPTATVVTLPTSTPIPRATATIANVTTPAPSATSSGAPTHLTIPSIGLEAPIITVGFVNYEIDGQTTTTWAVPSLFAAGWHHTSAPPGQAGNTVLNGHQNIHGGVFQGLTALETGDEIIVYVGETAHHYRVSERHLLAEEGQPLAVRAQNAQWILPTQDERLTLVTCAPSEQSTHRLIVVALPVGATP